MSTIIEESKTREIEDIEEIKKQLSEETVYTKRRELSQKIINLFLALRIDVRDPRDVPIDLQNITNIILIDAYLAYANLRYAVLSGLNLSRAHLQGAKLEGANLTYANLQGAVLMDADLKDANLEDANLYGADLYSADLTGANLTGANLTGANLTGADLTGTNLTGADLTGANLTDANLTDANLTGVTGLNTPTAPRQGIAHEIHNAFEKFKAIEQEYLAIINQPKFEGDIYELIETKFTENITTTLFPEDVYVKLQDFNTAFTKMGKSISNKDKQLIAKSISFAFAQEDNFKQQYIINFLDETCNAFSGTGDNTSCVKGIIERFVLCVGNAVQNVCSDGCENKTYKKLDKLMNEKFDIEDLSKASATWWEKEAINSKIKNMTLADRKENFIQYLIEEAKKHKGYKSDVHDSKIKEYANDIDYAFAELKLGGKKTRKSRKTKKSRKSKKAKKSRKLENRKNSSKSRQLKR